MRRGRILNGRHRCRQMKNLSLGLLKKEISALEATTQRLKFYGRRTYMEAVNLCFERHKPPLRPGEKIRIHFLFIIPSYWPAWRSFYEACRADARLEVTIVLLDCSGTPMENQQRLGARKLLEEIGLPYKDYADYDPGQENPHLIFYSQPYNNYYEYFRKVSPDLIKAGGHAPLYCTYGIEYDASKNKEWINIAHYHHDAQSLAWRSFVMHEDIREGYFRFCRTGGAHVFPIGHPKFDIYAGSHGEPPRQILEKQKGRKLVIFQVHHPNNHDCLSKDRTHHLPLPEIVAIIQWLAEQENVFTAITLHPLFSSWSVERREITPEALEQLKMRIAQSQNTSLYQGDYQALLPLADAFISGQSSLLLEMAFQNKPVLYLYDEPLALKPFAEEIFASFYHGRGYGHGLLDVQTFVARLNSGDDPLAGKRQNVLEKFFSSVDGQIGLRMKEHIIDNLLWS